MHHNRILHEAPIRLPRPELPPSGPGAFMLCPFACLPGLPLEQWLWQQYLYRCAFEEAQAVVRPSLIERDLLAVWN